MPFIPRILRDFATLAKSPPIALLRIPRHVFLLVVNVATQYLCVRGVNRLAAISSALTITIVLNVRKFISLALSVAIFGNPLATGVKIGGVFVAIGAAWYALESNGRPLERYPPNYLPSSSPGCVCCFPHFLRVVARTEGYSRNRGRERKCHCYRNRLLAGRFRR